MVKQVIASSQITLTDLGDAIISGTKPTNPKLDQLWIERKTGNPDKLWRWNGTAWIEQTLDLNSLDPDADGKIENHDKTIGNMVDDSRLDVTERQEVKNKLIPIVGQAVADNLAALPDSGTLWNDGVGEITTIRKAANNVGMKTSDSEYAAATKAYADLRAYLNAMTPVKPWDASATNKDKVISVVPADWRGKWLDYFKAIQNLTVAIQTKLQGNIDGIDIGVSNIIPNSMFSSIDGWRTWGTATGTRAVNVPVDFPACKTGFQFSTTTTGQYGYAMDGLPVIVGETYTLSAWFKMDKTGRVMIQEGTNPWTGNKIDVPVVNQWFRMVWTFVAKDNTTNVYFGQENTSEATSGYVTGVKLEKGNKATSWIPAQADIDKAIKDADDKAQKVTDSVNDMSLDSKLTPVEKIQLKTDYESITAEFATTLAAADAFNLTSSSERAGYNAAYDALKKLVDPLLVKMNETSGVDRNVFRQRFKDYYDTKAKLLKKISDTSKGMIDNIDVGARNLIKNSTFNQKNKYWAGNYDVLPPEPDKPTSSILNINRSGETVNRNAQNWCDAIEISADGKKEFAVSFDIKTTDFNAIDSASSFTTLFSIRAFDDPSKTSQNDSVWYQNVDKSNLTLKNNEWYRVKLTIKPSSGKYIKVAPYLTLNGNVFWREIKLESGNKATEWTLANEDVTELISDADKKAEESKTNIANMSSDSKLTPIEKVQLKKEWAVMAAEKPQYESLGNTFKATSELNAYINAYNVLNNTLNGTTGYLKNMQTTDTINGATFRAQFDDYYDKKSVLIKRVNQIIQGNIDDMEVKTANYVFNSTFKFGSANWTGIDSVATRNTTTVKGLEGYGIYTGLRITDATSFMVQNLKTEPFVAVKGFVSTFVNVRTLQSPDNNRPRVYMRFSYDQGDPANPKHYYAICNQDTVTNGWVRISLPFDTRGYTGKLIEVRVNLATAGMTSADVDFAGVMVNLGDKLADWITSVDDTAYGEISVQGSAFEQTDKYRKLIVNGQEIYNESAGRGLRMTTLRRTDLKVTYDTTFDVYGSAAERTNLVNKINSMKDDAFVVLSSWDAINIDANLASALTSIGGSGSTMNGRVPFAFIGMKGLGRYNGLEQYTGVGVIFSPAQVSAKVNNGSLQGVNNNTGAADTTMRQDLRITAPLPTSISMDANGITASTTTAGKYARLDYRGLFIAGGALQIEGGLTEQQLASGVTKKMSYLDSNGLYTGQVNIGGSGTNGILSIKNASNNEIVRGDTNGLYVKNGALTIERPDGAKFISNGVANFDFTVTSHEPYFRAMKIEQNGWWWQTKSSGGISDQSCNYYSFRKVGRYLKFRLGYFSGGGAGGVIIYAGDGKTILWSRGFEHTNSQYEEEVSIDLGVPNYGLSAVYLALNSYSLGYMYLRNLRCWIEG